MSDDVRRVLIVGASMGGQSAAIELRKNGFTGEVVLIGGEEHLPYDRPPLSKKIITGEWDMDKILLKERNFYEDKGIQLKLGSRVVQVDTNNKSVTTEAGETEAYDILILSTGGSPRQLNVPGRDLAGIYQVSQYADAIKVQEDLGVGVNDIVVVGAGFIGAEAAAALCQHGKNVTLIEVSPAPMSLALGGEVGEVFNKIFRDEGVKVETGTTVASYQGEHGRVAEVHSSDGRVFPADLVIEAVGIIPNVELAEAAGCRIDNGVIVDDQMRTSVSDIYAIGDIARFPSRYAKGPRSEDTSHRVRIEHWAVAIGHGAAAARSICGLDEPFDDLPWFWSDQFETTYNYAGHATEWDETVWRGDPEGRKFSVFYLLDGKLAGALCASRPKDFRGAKLLLTKGAAVDKEILKDPEADLLKYARSA